MKNSPKNNLAKVVAVTLLGTALTGITLQASAIAPKMEKCHGVVKKGENDCATKKHSCATKATTDGARDEWIYLRKGNCQKIVGGHLSPTDQTNQQQGEYP